MTPPSIMIATLSIEDDYLSVQPTLTALTLYDATYLYMMIAADIMARNESIQNGSLVLANARGRAFSGMHSSYMHTSELW